MGERECKGRSGESVPITDGSLLLKGVMVREYGGDERYCEL